MSDDDDNVVELGVATRLNIPAERVLANATDALYEAKGVVVIGWDKDGEFYFASSIADGGDVLWLMEHAKLALLGVD